MDADTIGHRISILFKIGYNTDEAIRIAEDDVAYIETLEGEIGEYLR